MHLYMITRGIKHQVDKFINELSAKYLSYRAKRHKDGKSEIINAQLQIGVRPIQLWEVTFPEEHLGTILNTFFKDESGFKQMIETGGFAQHQKKYSKFIWPLRKILGAKKIPENIKNDMHFLPLEDAGVQKIMIGIKEDSKDEDGVEQI